MAFPVYKLKNVGKDVRDSITGNVESACLIVKDWRKDGVTEIETDELYNTEAELVGIKDRGIEMDDFAYMRGACYDKRFKVQFNPCKLIINSSSMVESKSNTQANKKGEQEVFNVESKVPDVLLTVDLIFDHVNIYDAFMVDKGNMGASASTITNIASDIAASSRGKIWTVQTEVEGLIAALCNPLTRLITFQWADFSFSGMLNYVNATYKMFSVSGRPIRAIVQVKLSQKMDPRLMKTWYDDFDHAFKSGGFTKLASKAGKVGNILNINL